jgi:sulfatase maturation enzyme AslB (radical SAM superfamily)
LTLHRLRAKVSHSKFLCTNDKRIRTPEGGVMTTDRTGPDSRTPATNQFHRLLAVAEARHQLLSAHWELTYRCNERCTHCYLDVLPANHAAPGELTTEEGLRLLADLHELGALNLTLSGGEPLLRRDFFTLAERARTLGFVLRIFTNGVLITPAVADRLAALHPYTVEISLYGADAATHDALTRRRGSFARSIAALCLLVERNVRTVLKTPLLHENVRQFWQIKQLAADLGARFRFDLTLIPKLTGDRAPLRHQLTYADLLWFYRQTLTPAQRQHAASGPWLPHLQHRRKRHCHRPARRHLPLPGDSALRRQHPRDAPARHLGSRRRCGGSARPDHRCAARVQHLHAAFALRPLSRPGRPGARRHLRQPATANCRADAGQTAGAASNRAPNRLALPLTPHLAALLPEATPPRLLAEPALVIPLSPLP